MDDFFNGMPMKVRVCECWDTSERFTGRPAFLALTRLPAPVASRHGIHIRCWTSDCQDIFAEMEEMYGLSQCGGRFNRWKIVKMETAQVGSAIEADYWEKWFTSLRWD